MAYLASAAPVVTLHLLLILQVFDSSDSPTTPRSAGGLRPALTSAVGGLRRQLSPRRPGLSPAGTRTRPTGQLSPAGGGRCSGRRWHLICTELRRRSRSDPQPVHPSRFRTPRLILDDAGSRAGLVIQPVRRLQRFSPVAPPSRSGGRRYHGGTAPSSGVMDEKAASRRRSRRRETAFGRRSGRHREIPSRSRAVTTTFEIYQDNADQHRRRLTFRREVAVAPINEVPT